MEEQGANVARLAVLFCAPPELALEWDTGALLGQRRFLNRVAAHGEALAGAPPQAQTAGARQDATQTAAMRQQTAATIAAVTESMDVRRALNVAIARLMELSNAVARCPKAAPLARREAVEALVLMLAPFAPHAAEHLWATLLESSGRGAYAPGGGANADSVHAQPWPMVDDKALAATRVPPVVVMVNGRTRCVVELDQAAARPTKDDIVRIVRADARVLAALKGASVAREIVVLPAEGAKADAKCIVDLVLTSAR